MPGFTKQLKRYNKTPARRKVQGVGAQTNRPIRNNIQVVLSASTVPDTFMVATFNVPVVWNGELPVWQGAHNIVSVSQRTSQIYDIVWSGTISPAANIDIAFSDPAFRDLSGGYVNPGNHVVV